MKYAFDIGGTKIEFGVIDDQGDILHRQKVPTPLENRDDFTGVIAGLVAEADARFAGCDADADTPPPPVGISFAGGLAPETGAVISANIPPIKGWPIARGLGDILKCAVRVENDADCFALAEARLGAGQGSRTVFAIILGTGVGGGVVVDGQFIGGRSGIRGEWGHGNDISGPLMRHGIKPRQCGCGGASCLDPWGGARGLERIHAALHGKDLPSQEITAAWRAGNGDALKTIDVFVDLVAGQLRLMVNVLDPDIVPVGGGLAAEQGLIARIDAAVRANVLGRYDHALVVPGQFFADGGLRGAALLHDVPA
ncbi:ROK family transcriptional regulator [Thalassospira profundimaris]|uniref:ROK family transcriptional regulator n=1 Tax=Thalassospira profundimaris TaxID=502049 RepID=A0A367X0B8_9PROT|nr:ROK family protein [Thalassospira profundimaris]RCK47088.1 ROK family transcriptional regulator [Thalassospira profundimaris]